MVGLTLNIITFLLTTYFYYKSLKPKLSYEALTNNDKYQEYMKKNYASLGIYFLLTTIIQFFINTYAISSNCGGSLTENLTASAMLTFIPWALIFGAVVIIITVYPGFKSAFSNVIGYYFVSKDANSLLVDLLLNQKIDKTLNGSNATNPSLPNYNISSEKSIGSIDSPPPTNNMKGGIKRGGSVSNDEKQRIEDAADAIIKICGNTSILINQIVPANFSNYWETLNPLMKPKYRDNSPDGIGMRKQLFDITRTRDTIGEALWYIYTGILICCMIQMKMASRGCESNLQAMEQKYQQFKQEEAQELAAKSTQKETEYTITN
jgi:hypothetical protein